MMTVASRFSDETAAQSIRSMNVRLDFLIWIKSLEFPVDKKDRCQE